MTVPTDDPPLRYRLTPGPDGQRVAWTPEGLPITAADVAASLEGLERTYRGMVATGYPPALVARFRRLWAARLCLYAALTGDAGRYGGPPPARLEEWRN